MLSLIIVYNVVQWYVLQVEMLYCDVYWILCVY